MLWAFGPDEVRGAVMTCPNGHAFSISGGRFGSVHTIAHDGVVSPSVVCPRCAFHDFVQLVGWALTPV